MPLPIAYARAPLPSTLRGGGVLLRGPAKQIAG